MKKNVLQRFLFVLLVVYGCWLHGDLSIASLNNLGLPMAHGVCDTMAAVADSGMTVFIAPMEERMDSTIYKFNASYLKNDSDFRELLSGYERKLAQPPISRYWKTTNVCLTANKDFSAFAIIVEKINSPRPSSAGSDVIEPMSLGTWLAVVDAFGNPLQEMELTSTEGSVSASQCHVSFSDDGKLLAACGQYIGLRLYDSPTTDLMSFTTLDIGYKTGTAIITGDGTKVFFTQDGASKRAVCYVDTAMGTVVDTGLIADGGINDAQLAVNHDGSCVAFRKTASSLAICSLEDGTWKETVIDGTKIRSPVVSADGLYVVYQTRGVSCSQIMEYDRKKGMTTLISQNDGGMEADADCTSPSISRDGLRIAFVSAASNLVANGNGQPQLLVFQREVPSFTLELKRGWNLCGTPLTLDEQSVELLKRESPCWGWRNGKFCLMESFQAGQGFWLYSFEDKVLRLTGEEAEPMPLRLGWNLVLPILYPSAETTIRFGFDGKSYEKLSEEADRAQAAWVWH